MVDLRMVTDLVKGRLAEWWVWGEAGGKLGSRSQVRGHSQVEISLGGGKQTEQRAGRTHEHAALGQREGCRQTCPIFVCGRKPITWRPTFAPFAAIDWLRARACLSRLALW